MKERRKKIKYFMKYIEASTDIRFVSISDFYKVDDDSRTHIVINIQDYICFIVSFFDNRIGIVDICYYRKSVDEFYVNSIYFQIAMLLSDGIDVELTSCIKKNLITAKKMAKLINSKTLYSE